MATRTVIESRQNALVKRLRALGGKREGNEVLLEGRRLIDDALGAGARLTALAVSPAYEERHETWVRTVADRGVAVHRIAESVLGSVSDLTTPPGVLAVGEAPVFEESRLFARTPLLVVAVAIQNPGNLGGLLRTAEAAGATGAFLTDGSADPWSSRALRGSMGSAFRLPHRGPLSMSAVLAALQARGLRLFAAAAGGVAHTAADLRGPCAIFFGNEGAGLPEDVLHAAHQRLAVPMAGPVESLNVGVAAGVILFEAARQRQNDSRACSPSG